MISWSQRQIQGRGPPPNGEASPVIAVDFLLKEFTQGRTGLTIEDLIFSFCESIQRVSAVVGASVR